MLLLYLLQRIIHRFYLSLYIPLCFYYITTAVISLTAFSIFTFHYASTISWCFNNGCYLFNCFTFHYASTISNPGLKSWYVRLIFTFHYASTISINHKIKTVIISPFTFHYASTISPTDIGHYPISISFTFHYASTISVYGLKLDAHLRPLHSTMLLLYPNVFPAITMFSHFTFHYASTISELRSQNPWLHRLYIPLCFYYIKTRLQ